MSPASSGEVSSSPTSPADGGASSAWAAVVVDYNAGPLLEECIASILADDSAPVDEIVVVDNDSHDGSADAVAHAHPEVVVLRPGANLGYARGANLGIAACRAPLVAVVNPDARVEPGTAAAMRSRFDADARLGALGPRILNPDGSVYPSARRAPGPTIAAGHALLGGIAPRNRFTRRYRMLDTSPDVARDVDWVSGAAVWLRREALDEVGGWDERYFLFLEDVDLGRSLDAAGWRVAYEPTGTVVHAVGASRAGRPVRSVVAHHRAAYRFVDKWWHGPRRVLLPPVAVGLAARAGVELAGLGAGRLARSVRRRVRPGGEAASGRVSARSESGSDGE